MCENAEWAGKRKKSLSPNGTKYTAPLMFSDEQILLLLHEFSHPSRSRSPASHPTTPSSPPVIHPKVQRQKNANCWKGQDGRLGPTAKPLCVVDDKRLILAARRRRRPYSHSMQIPTTTTTTASRQQRRPSRSITTMSSLPVTFAALLAMLSLNDVVTVSAFQPTHHHHTLLPTTTTATAGGYARPPIISLQNQQQRHHIPRLSRNRHTAAVSISSSELSSSIFSNDTDEVLEIPQQHDQHDDRRLQTPVTTFTTVEECLDAMDGSTSDLTVVLFFAHYCKKCHQANIPYKRLAYTNPTIQFTRLETSLMSSRQLKALGVTRVPFLQIYRNGICVASFATPWKLETQLSETLGLCRQRSVSDWLAFCQQHDAEIQSNKDARRGIRSEITPSQLPTGSSPSGNPQQQQQQVHSHNPPVKTLASELQLVMAIDKTRSSTDAAATTTTSGNNGATSGLLDIDDRTIGRGLVSYEGSSNSNSNDRQNSEKPAVIMFHSHFGHSSLRAQHQFTRIAESSPYNEGFNLFRIESSTLPDSTLKELGISKYPHIQIYRDGKCVASFSIPQTYLFSTIVQRSLDEFNQRTDAEWDDFMAQFQSNIASNQQVIESIRNRHPGP